MSKIRVLIVDDSALMRQLLTALLSSDQDIEVVGAASDPYIARDKIKALNPDVLTLDVEMPKMDGLTFLEKLMAARPMPVVMVSSLTEAGCQTTLKALELGAVDFFTKPKFDMQGGIEEQAQELIFKVKAAAQARIIQRRPFIRAEVKDQGVRVSGCKTPLHPYTLTPSAPRIVAIGASTGGTEAIRELLEVLPPDAPPILITQHMPEKFTKAFADRLNDLCQIKVKEAVDGESVIMGQALIAPGNYHMMLVMNGAGYQVTLNQGPPVNRHRPSVDVMFQSVARHAGKNCVGLILTGMGHDGAAGMLEMKRAGAYTIAQDEASCVVFGMPREAIKLGGVDKTLSLSEIPAAILAYLNYRYRGACQFIQA